MKQVAEERLDMIPLNRQVGYLTDAYCIDWVYGKNRIVLSQFAIVFTEKIQTEQYTIKDVEYIAKNIFYDSPIEILSITIFNFIVKNDFEKMINYLHFTSANSKRDLKIIVFCI